MYILDDTHITGKGNVGSVNLLKSRWSMQEWEADVRIQRIRTELWYFRRPPCDHLSFSHTCLGGLQTKDPVLRML